MLYDIRFGLFWLCRVFVLQNLTDWVTEWLSDWPNPTSRDPSDLKMANFEDFPPIFCPSNDFLPQGRGRILVKYWLVCLLYKQCIFPTIKPPLLHDEIKFTFCSVQSFVNYGEYSKHGCRQWPGSDPARLDKCPSVSSCQLPAWLSIISTYKTFPGLTATDTRSSKKKLFISTSNHWVSQHILDALELLDCSGEEFSSFK